MDQPSIATVVALLVLLASMASVELGISVALIEISLGVVAGNFLGLSSPAWMDFLAGLAGIVLTFLAGAEVDPDLLRERLKESVLIGGLSFLLPFAGAAAVCYYGLGWSANGALIAGTALSTTSLAVVYAVLVETGLTETMIGKIIMASTFVTDFGTALALSVLFLRPTWWLLPFVLVSGGIIWAMPRLHPWFFPRYGNRVIEPEIKGALAALLVLMFFAHLAESHAVLPAFILGLAVARVFSANRETQRRFRVVAFALLRDLPPVRRDRGNVHCRLRRRHGWRPVEVRCRVSWRAGREVQPVAPDRTAVRTQIAVRQSVPRDSAPGALAPVARRHHSMTTIISVPHGHVPGIPPARQPGSRGFAARLPKPGGRRRGVVP